MNWAEMVVLIVLIATIGKVFRARYQASNTVRPTVSEDAGRLREEVRTLKERIAVLERLATDDNNAARIDREIEKLRDRS